MGDERITPSDADELASCFAANAGAVFGYACALTRGDRALSGDLVQDTFEAAARDWAVFRDLGDEDRRGWLRRTVANSAVGGLRQERSRKTPDGPVFCPGLLERCGHLITGLPERQYAVALMR